MQHHQPQLFSDSNPVEVINRDGRVRHQPEYLSIEEADALFSYLNRNLDWQQRKIFIFGEWHLQPRLIAFLGNDEILYSYSGDTLRSILWPDEIAKIAVKLSKELKNEFNVVLANYYQNGEDSMGWHADNETELGKNPMIASISLGQPRKFKLRHRDGEQKNLVLEHGSLLTMSGECQQYWQHALPKIRTDGARINLTFRKIIT